MKVKDIMAAGDVKRWHIMNMARHQSLAEHQWTVTMLARQIGMRTTFWNIDNFELQITRWALVHDINEVWGGDPPNVSPPEDIVQRLSEISDEVGLIVKMADLMDAAFFSNENAVGTRARKAADLAMSRLFIALDKCPNIEVKRAARDVWNEIY